jgi:decaprenylphospho-beta-D-erythro-pentofuranosid-2-ulose 2-reductase
VNRTVRKVVIIGALSAIAEETGRLLAARGCDLLLIGRRPERLEEVAADLRVRGAGQVLTTAVDLGQIADPFAFMAKAGADLGGMDAVLIFHGVMHDEQVAARDIGALRDILSVNFNSAIELAAAAAVELEASSTPKPVLVGIGSVAGDRGRASNRAYGAAKAGFGAYLQGLAQRGAASKVWTVVVKPGFTDTPMTSGLKKGGPLWSSPARVAKDIVRAIDGAGPTVYSPWFWRWILLIIRLLPHPIMAKLPI